MNRQQQDVIEFLREENRILREKLGHKRLILNESQKQRPATPAMKLGKGMLRQFGTLFSPSTLLKWHRWLVARRYDSSDRRGKRGPAPTKANMIRKLVLQDGRPASVRPARSLSRALDHAESAGRQTQPREPRLAVPGPGDPHPGG